MLCEIATTLYIDPKIFIDRNMLRKRLAAFATDTLSFDQVWPYRLTAIVRLRYAPPEMYVCFVLQRFFHEMTYAIAFAIRFLRFSR